MYLNGQLAGSSKDSGIDATNYAVSNAYDVYVGWGQYGGGYIKGKIDNIRFWNKGLSQPEVDADQTSTVSAATPNLIAAYDFTDVDLDTMTVADTKGNYTAYLQGYGLKVSSLQQVGMTGRGNTNDPILRATTVVSATDAVGQAVSSATLTNAVLNLSGTTNLSDIISLKIYSTGTTPNFDPRDPTGKGAILLGTCSPAAGDITCTLNGTLTAGTQYLWVAADIANDAVEGNQIDISLKSITAGFTYTLGSNNPKDHTNIMLARKLIVVPGDAGSTHYRIPSVMTANDGSLLAFTDKRKYNNYDLPQDIDVVVHRSTDNGKTWSSATTIAQGTGVGGGFGDVATVKTITGKIIAIFAGGPGFSASTSSNPIKVYKSESTDNGVSWSAPTDITTQLYAQGCNDPTHAAWSGMFIASGQMLYTSTGRIMAVALVRGDGSGTNNNYIVYSDDDGASWTMSNSKVISAGNEAKIMELADGTFMVTSRKIGARLKATSVDGLTWSGTSTSISELVEPGCNGDFIRYSKTSEGAAANILLHSIPNNSGSRRNVSVFVSTDEGATWPTKKSIVPEMANNGLSGYSSLTVLPDGTIGAYVEVENYSGAYEMYFMNFSLGWLTDNKQSFTENRWTGATSSDFNNAANWASGVVPSGTPNITLAGNAGHPLVLSGTKTLGTITVNPGARLTIESETVTATSITLISDGKGTGTVIDHSGSTNRTAIVKTQLTGKTGAATNDHWWYIATPVTGATSNVLKSYTSNLFGYYDEVTNNYPQITNTTTELTKGTGYLVKLAGATSYYSFPGSLNNGDITINLTRTGTTNPKRGFNLIGNPYPSYINWNMLLGSRTDIRSTIWIRTRTKSGEMAFDTWNGLIGTGNGKKGAISQYIAPMQAFWVKVDRDGTNPSLTFNNALRSHRPGTNASGTLLRAPNSGYEANSEPIVIRLQISNERFSDETIIMTHSTASDGPDSFDAEKISNNNPSIPEIFTLIDQREIAINTMQQLPLQQPITLGFRPGASGQFTLTASEISHPENLEVVLIDKLTGTSSILNNDSYGFSSDGTATNDRFSLEFRTTGITTITGNPNGKLILTTTDNQIIIDGTTEGSNINVYNSIGQLLISTIATALCTGLTKPGKGIYIVKVNNQLFKVILH